MSTEEANTPDLQLKSLRVLCNGGILLEFPSKQAVDWLKDNDRLQKLADVTHQQNTLFWTVLDRATQIPRAHSLVHSGQVCPDTHSLWVPVQLCPDTHSYELLASSGQYNPSSSIILPFITRLS